VYLRMFVGLLISAFCALGVASSPAALGFIFGNQLVFWGMFIQIGNCSLYILYYGRCIWCNVCLWIFYQV
jgi:hypothetical protein